jgi:hypothetical protein
MQAAKVDYIRIRLTFDMQQAGAEKAELEEIAELMRAKVGETSKCYDVSAYHDKAIKQSVLFFNVWGATADEVFHWLSSAWLMRLMRIDVRHALDDTKMDFKAIYELAEARAGAKYTVHRFRSPYKQKRQGRDAGGSGVTIGGQGAARRISIYQRSNEGPAWEYQFSGKPLYTLLTDLKANGTSQDRSFQDEIVARVLEDGYRYSSQRFGTSVEGLERGIVSAAPLTDYTDPEAVLDRIEQLWLILPDDAQEAFLETKGNLTEHEAALIVEAASMLEEADWLEDEAGARPDTSGIELVESEEPSDLYPDANA